MKFLRKTEDGTEYFADDKFIFAKKGGDVFKLALFDKSFFKLRLFNGVPVLEIDGLRMQLVKGFKNPLDYPKEVVGALDLKSRNIVLDTCTGLGYTAIEAAQIAGRVVTCEISETVLSLAQWNPWSEMLFDTARIEILEGDVAKKIKGFQGASFNAIIHDPPRMSKAGQLYSSEFYCDLYRVLRKNGRLFHYVGSFGQNKGRKIFKEVAARLKNAGFRNIRYRKRLQGLLAEK